jgi:hypothetical protein
MVLSDTLYVAASYADHGQPHIHWQGRTTTLKCQDKRSRKVAWEKDVGPTHMFTASPEVGSVTTVVTLRIGYPCVQAPSRDEGPDVCSHIRLCHLARAARCCHTSCGSGSRALARGSSGAAMCPMVLAPESRLGAARVLPCVSWCQPSPPLLGQLKSRHVSHGSSSRLLAHDSFGAIMYPMVPAPATWLRVAPEPPHLPWSSTGCGLLKQINIP